MNNVARIAPEIRDIHVPAPLRDLPLWCVWAYEQHPGEAKARKVPQYTAGGRRHGKQGSPEDLAKLTTFALARDAAARRGMDGVGFALTQDTGIVALDFDNCVTDGVVNPIVANLVRNTYAEYSPSGKGVRAFFWGDLGNRKCFSKDHAFAVETFTSSGFVTVTGNMLPIVDLLGNEDRVATLPNEVEDYCLQRFRTSQPQADVDPEDFMLGREPRLGLSIEQIEELLSALDPDMGREDWIRVGMALHHETDGDDTGFELWDEWSSGGYSYPSTEGLRTQWDSFERRAGQRRRQVTMASVIKMAKDAGARPSEAGSRKEVLAKAEAIMADLPKKSLGRFGPVPVYDLTQRPPMSWLIKGVLPKARLGVLFGASGSGKTFVGLDIAFSIARGVAWRDRRTVKGNVVIIAAEGGSGIGKRAEAYAQYHDFDLREVDNLFVITAAPNFLDADDISEVLAEIQNLGMDIDLILIDTLAQVTPGANENTSEDMGRALGNINLLHEAMGSMILVVHHAGKDLSKGSRGWSGLKAAADVQKEVLRHESGEREIVIEKMKDGEDGLRWGLKLEVIDLGIDLDGDPVTSCVAVPAEAVRRKEDDRKGVKKRGRMENHILEIMTLFDDRGVVPAHELIDRAVADLPEPEPGKRDIRRQSLIRAIHSLSREKDGPLKMENGKIFFFE